MEIPSSQDLSLINISEDSLWSGLADETGASASVPAETREMDTGDDGDTLSPGTARRKSFKSRPKPTKSPSRTPTKPKTTPKKSKKPRPNSLEDNDAVDAGTGTEEEDGAGSAASASKGKKRRKTAESKEMKRERLRDMIKTAAENVTEVKSSVDLYALEAQATATSKAQVFTPRLAPTIPLMATETASTELKNTAASGTTAKKMGKWVTVSSPSPLSLTSVSLTHNTPPAMKHSPLTRVHTTTLANTLASSSPLTPLDKKIRPTTPKAPIPPIPPSSFSSLARSRADAIQKEEHSLPTHSAPTSTAASQRATTCLPKWYDQASAEWRLAWEFARRGVNVMVTGVSKTGKTSMALTMLDAFVHSSGKWSPNHFNGASLDTAGTPKLARSTSIPGVSAAATTTTTTTMAAPQRRPRVLFLSCSGSIAAAATHFDFCRLRQERANESLNDSEMLFGETPSRMTKSIRESLTADEKRVTFAPFSAFSRIKVVCDNEEAKYTSSTSMDKQTWQGKLASQVARPAEISEFTHSVHNLRLRHALQENDVLFLDDVHLCSQEEWEAAEFLARCMRKRDLPWGGMQVIAFGNLALSIGANISLQCTPILQPHTPRHDSSHAKAFDPYAWPSSSATTAPSVAKTKTGRGDERKHGSKLKAVVDDNGDDDDEHLEWWAYTSNAPITESPTFAATFAPVTIDVHEVMPAFIRLSTSHEPFGTVCDACASRAVAADSVTVGEPPITGSKECVSCTVRHIDKNLFYAAAKTCIKKDGDSIGPAYQRHLVNKIAHKAEADTSVSICIPDMEEEEEEELAIGNKLFSKRLLERWCGKPLVMATREDECAIAAAAVNRRLMSNTKRRGGASAEPRVFRARVTVAATTPGAEDFIKAANDFIEWKVEHMFCVHEIHGALTLAVGARVMLTTRIAGASHLAPGSFGTVVGWTTEERCVPQKGAEGAGNRLITVFLPMVEFYDHGFETSKTSTTSTLVPVHRWSETIFDGIQIYIQQLPLIPAWALPASLLRQARTGSVNVIFSASHQLRLCSVYSLLSRCAAAFFSSDHDSIVHVLSRQTRRGAVTSAVPKKARPLSLLPKKGGDARLVADDLKGYDDVDSDAEGATVKTETPKKTATKEQRLHFPLLQRARTVATRRFMHLPDPLGEA